MMRAWSGVVLASLLAVGCGSPVSSGDASAPSGPPPDPAVITAEPSLRARVVVGQAERAQVAASQTVAARIEVDERRVARIGSPVLGRVRQLAAEEGQFVRKGDLLALLDSPELGEAQLAFLKARSARDLADRAVERARVLLAADVIGQAELQKRDAERAQAQAEFDAAHDQLILLGMHEDAIDDLARTHRIRSVTRIVATMSGTVLHRFVAAGQVVQPADTTFEIADLSALWLQADVPEPSAGGLAIGTAVTAQVAALPDARIEGALSFVSATVNEQTRTVRVRMDLANPHGRFKPAMLATVSLRARPADTRVVPVAAVVREGDTEHVFVQQADDTFVLRPVVLGAEHEGQRVLEDGLREGERIVVDGAFHLNNERRRRLLRGGADS